jgi:hypothetical protein
MEEYCVFIYTKPRPRKGKKKMKKRSRKRKKVTANERPAHNAVSRLPDDYKRILSIIIAMRNWVNREAIALAAANPHWDKTRDVRITAFAHTVAIIESAMIGIVFSEGMLARGGFWSEAGLNYESDSAEDVATKKRDMESMFDIFMRGGFIQTQFSVTEAALRLFLRALDPAACKAGTAAFKTIYECLLKKLSEPIPDAIDLLDLWREIRNTIHNSGVYYNKDGVDKTLVYKGKTFSFLHGQSINFVGWDKCGYIAFEAVQLLFKVVNDDVIKNYPGLILDPGTERGLSPPAPRVV